MRRIGTCLLFVLSAAAQQPSLRDYGRLPLVFEPNQGQTGPPVKFFARTGGGALFLTEREMVFAARDAEPVRMRLAGSRKPQSVRGLDPTGGISNYFIGDDPSKWRTGIPHYSRVEYKSVYAGVDLVYYGNPQKLEYDLVVAPGADASVIQVEYSGVESLRVDGNGDLVLTTSGGELRQKRPIAYQETAAGRIAVEVGHRLKGRRVAFELAGYDAKEPLTIDPVLLYSTYLGGAGIDQGTGIAVDGSGNSYITGQTTSVDFPTANPLMGNTGTAAFVTKINAAGSAKVYSTYLGGSGVDTGTGIALDAAGSAYITGYTQSTNFPIADPLQASNAGGRDAFVTKINAAGSSITYSTYLGGNQDEYAGSIAVDSAGNAYVTGQTESANFPTTNPLQPAKADFTDAFIAKINAAGSAKVYSTYWGGNGVDTGGGIAADSSGNAYVTGATSSTNFPTSNPFQPDSGGGGFDAFVTKINPLGSAAIYSSYLGGNSYDAGSAIVLDGAGNAYVAGSTQSSNFPTTNPLQAGYNGNSDVFVTKINAAGSARVYSTYLGGSSGDEGFGIAVDGAGNAYVTGTTSSANFPTRNPLQAANGSTGGHTMFIAKINAIGSSTVYSTYLGGSGSAVVDGGSDIAVDSSGNVYVTGSTNATNFPVTLNALQPSRAANDDAFLTSISGNSPVAAFRDSSGAVHLTSELSTSLSNSGGVFASDPSAAQNASGDTFVVARDAANSVWLNVYDARTRNWDGWISAGATVQGTPALVPVGNTAYIVARDSSNAYWTNTFTRGTGFSGWVNLGGSFATDPAIGTFPLCCLYIAGKDSFNAIWTIAWLLGGSPGPWQLQGAVAQGKPSVTGGSDGSAYIAIRDPSNSVWMGRQNGTSPVAWQPGGGTVASDPQVAAVANVVYAAALTSNGGVWYNTFTPGIGNNWTGWLNTGGALSSLSAAASTGPQFFLTGRDGANQLWWYETPGAGWKFVGHAGVAAGPLSAAPR